MYVVRQPVTQTARTDECLPLTFPDLFGHIELVNVCPNFSLPHKNILSSKSVTSKDRPTISYHRFGHGPGLIILYGAIHTWRSHRELAETLSNDFAVYVPDRRGCGLSSDPGANYGMQTEVGDVEALAKATGARFVFGNSSGALISLQSCLEMPKLFTKTVIFKPPLLAVSVHGLFPRFREEIEKGDRASALVTAMRIAEMGPPIFRSLPY